MGNMSKDLNLYKALKKSRTKNKKSSGKANWILPPIIIATILGGVFVYFFIQNNKLETRINEIEEYINNPTISSKYEEYTNLQGEVSELVELRRVLKGFKESQKTYPSFTSSIFDTIKENIGDIEIREITYHEANGHIVMRAFANEIHAASKFTEDLYKTGVFEKVNYSGWSLGRENTYTFTVTCLLIVEVENK